MSTLPAASPPPPPRPRRPAELGSAADRDTTPHSGARTFWQLLHRVCEVAGGVHLAFVGIFGALGATALAVANAIAFALFVVSRRLLQRRLNLAALGLIGLEIVMHAALAVRSIGWDSGFHYYLIVVVPVVSVSRLPRGLKQSTTLAVCLIYIGLDLGLGRLPPLYRLDESVVTGLRLLNVATTFALLAYFSRHYYNLVRQAEERLREMAATDPLTRLFNRRRISDTLQYEMTRAKRMTAPLSVLLADLDHFKDINDREGHDCGDLVLVAISDVLRASVREQDSIARWGGEEFLIVLPDTSLGEAAQAAERIRQAVAQARIASGAGEPVEVTLTLGVAQLMPGEDAGAAISRADRALYQGKQAGRNRVQLSTG